MAVTTDEQIFRFSLVFADDIEQSIFQKLNVKKQKTSAQTQVLCLHDSFTAHFVLSLKVGKSD